MATLVNPVYRREPIMWGFVSCTAVTFLVVTVENAVYIGEVSGGPAGYSFPTRRLPFFPTCAFLERLVSYFMVPSLIQIVLRTGSPPPALPLLGDLPQAHPGHRSPGLVRYAFEFFTRTRRRPLCAKHRRYIAVGITFIHRGTVDYNFEWSTLPYPSISLSLNVLLTLVVVVRITPHARNARDAVELTVIGGLCKVVAIMLIEFCALYTVSLLSVIGTEAAGNPTVNFFMSIFPQTQVRAFRNERR